MVFMLIRVADATVAKVEGRLCGFGKPDFTIGLIDP